MRYLFKKQKKDLNSGENRIAVSIKRFTKKTQTGWAKWMAKKTANFSRVTWLILLSSFFVTGTGCCVLMITQTLFGKRPAVTGFNKIQKPQQIFNKRLPKATTGQFHSGNEFIRIRRFRVYMDSLSKSPEGKKKYDRIMADYPGLLDSARLIEENNQILINKNSELWKRKK